MTCRALQVCQELMGKLENRDQGEVQDPQDLKDLMVQQESQWVGTYHPLLLQLNLLQTFLEISKYIYQLL